MRIRPTEGQLALPLFQDEPKADRHREVSFRDSQMEYLTWAGCPLEVVGPMADRIISEFSHWQAEGRMTVLAHFYGKREPVRNLIGHTPEEMGTYEPELDYHVLWDRCWAARWIPFEEALNVKSWHYNYRRPYTGAPVHVWYIDNEGREVKRPYEG